MPFSAPVREVQLWINPQKDMAMARVIRRK